MRSTFVGRRIATFLTVLAVLSSAGHAARSVGARGLPMAAPERGSARQLLVPSQNDAGSRNWRLDGSTVEMLRDMRRDGLRGGELSILLPLPQADGVVRERTLRLERFDVAVPGARVVVGGERRPSSFDPSRVMHFRGSVDGDPSSRAYLALAELGNERGDGVAALGQFEVDGQRWVLGGSDPHRRGFSTGDLAIVAADGFGAPPLVSPCGADCCVPQEIRDAANAGGGVAGNGVAFFGPTERRLVRLAVETDFEFFTLFGDEEAAAAYVLALVGAVSDIYLREFDVAVGVTFIRLWDEEEGLYNDPDPLFAFRSHWNGVMGDVERNVAHLFTARRNLPYGGVAWVAALCTNNGYAVDGYLNGTFASAVDPSGGNWDLTVVAHELGHNCGTLHTHDYGIDDCAFGGVRRGGIMSYCHIVSGGVSNIDLNFDTLIRGYVKQYLASTECVWIDCDGNGVDDALDIMLGTLADENGDGIPDVCQDCNDNGILDPIEIALGLSQDIDGNGIPDECEPDCNNNGIPDSMDVGFGTSLDLNGNGVPDECETDCDGNGVMDWLQIIADMSLDVDRDGILDACQDCDGDGVADHIQLAGSGNLWVGAQGSGLRQFHIRSGAPAVDAETASIGFNALLHDLALAPDGVLLATHGNGNRVLAFDRVTGALLGERIGTAAGLVDPGTMLILDDGVAAPTMLISSTGNGRIVEFDPVSGALIRIVVPTGGGVSEPFGMAIHPDGSLLVGSLGSGPGGGSVERFDLDTGAHLGAFVTAGAGGLSAPRGVLILPDETVLVASSTPSALLRYGTDGTFIGRFDLGGNVNGTWGLRDPWCIRLADDGTRLFVTSRTGGTSVHTYAWPSGLFLRTYYVVSADLVGAMGLVQMERSPLDCNRNGLLDSCDIASGRSLDLNGNGIPDECEGALSADLNGDGIVDGADLGLLLNAWGPCDACSADLNGDGIVDGADLGILLANWTT